MALTTTTLSAAQTAGSNLLALTATTGLTAGMLIQVDSEFMLCSSVGTLNGVIRGVNGSVAAAHVSGANAVYGLASDFATPQPGMPLAYGAAKGFYKQSYSAAGAISLPAGRNDILAIINGTSALAMTIAAPTTDMDGSVLYVSGNGAANHTITWTGGLSGAGTSYDVVTINSTKPCCICAIAINGVWNSFVATPMAGTVTNITGTVA